MITREMLLLGAGASVEAEIPASHQMTERILEQFASQPPLRASIGFPWFSAPKEANTHYKVLAFVVGGLLFDKGIKGENPLKSGVNVEELFNAVDLLSQRNRSEASPFVGSWHSMVDEFDKIPAASPQAGKLHEIIFESVMEKVVEALKASPPAFGAQDIDKKLKELIGTSIEAAVKSRSHYSYSSLSVGREIQDYLNELIRKWTDKLKSSSVSSHDFAREFAKAIDQQPKPANGAIFTQVTEAMIRKLVGLVWIQPTEPQKRVQHLAPVLNLLDNQQRLVVATLNYDNSIEFLAHGADVDCYVALGDCEEPVSSIPATDGLHLLKLHGSIDWELHEPRQPFGRLLPFTQASSMQMPLKSVERIDPAKKVLDGYRPAVIFGQRNKLTAEGPFLDILRSFRDELEVSDVLTVVGYSFADDHVNEYISRWLNGDVHRKIQIVDISFESNQQPYANALKKLRAGARDRVRVLEKKANEALIELYGGRTAVGIPGTMSATAETLPADCDILPQSFNGEETNPR